MRILVTGGMGYLGRVLSGRLLRDGHSVTIVDSLLYSPRPIDPEGIRLVVEDIRNEAAVHRLVGEVDTVVHLAAIVGEPACGLDPETAVRVNYFASRALAEICKASGRRLIFCSTCSIYGVSDGSSLDEESRLQPHSIYALAKLAAEEAIRNINGDHLIFRLGTLYGYSPRMRFDLVVNKFVGQALQDGSISVFGGAQVRPFLHVADAAHGISMVVASEAKGVFNLGGENLRIGELALKIKSAYECEIQIFDELRDARNYLVISEKARDQLGITLESRIDSGIVEIGRAIRNERLKDYRDPLYDNKEYLLRLRASKLS